MHDTAIGVGDSLKGEAEWMGNLGQRGQPREGESPVGRARPPRQLEGKTWPSAPAL